MVKDAGERLCGDQTISRPEKDDVIAMLLFCRGHGDRQNVPCFPSFYINSTEYLLPAALISGLYVFFLVNFPLSSASSLCIATPNVYKFLIIPQIAQHRLWRRPHQLTGSRARSAGIAFQKHPIQQNRHTPLYLSFCVALDLYLEAQLKSDCQPRLSSYQGNPKNQCGVEG